MSTRSTTHFIDGDEKHPVAIVYRHSDGYPEGAGKDLLAFLKECQQLSDSRLNDPTYLAAKYVVFLADKFNSKYDTNPETGKLERIKAKSKLDFLSVGIMMQDPGDIEYRYVVDCSKLVGGLPRVKCWAVSQDYETGEWSRKAAKIPTD